ncbi:MAG: PTS sugar transporter subunit IIA [Lachnospiraceae bacterium]|nr:PTS sugar transporter subunit IIA [Lachnospiraceae bacterium]
MFFQKKNKKEESKVEKLALLYPENVRIGCKADTKENVIRTVGQMLVDAGYVNQSYVDAMLKREESFSTYMGNELALPHGVEEAKKDIKASGIAVMVFPEGTDWGGEQVKVVVGIAGVGEEHLQILSVIAEQMLEEGSVERITSGSVEDVYEMLKGGDEA